MSTKNYNQTNYQKEIKAPELAQLIENKKANFEIGDLNLSKHYNGTYFYQKNGFKIEDNEFLINNIMIEDLVQHNSVKPLGPDRGGPPQLCFQLYKDKPLDSTDNILKIIIDNVQKAIENKKLKELDNKQTKPKNTNTKPIELTPKTIVSTIIKPIPGMKDYALYRMNIVITNVERTNFPTRFLDDRVANKKTKQLVSYKINNRFVTDNNVHQIMREGTVQSINFQFSIHFNSKTDTIGSVLKCSSIVVKKILNYNDKLLMTESITEPGLYHNGILASELAQLIKNGKANFEISSSMTAEKYGVRFYQGVGFKIENYKKLVKKIIIKNLSQNNSVKNYTDREYPNTPQLCFKIEKERDEDSNDEFMSIIIENIEKATELVKSKTKPKKGKLIITKSPIQVLKDKNHNVFRMKVTLNSNKNDKDWDNSTKFKTIKEDPLNKDILPIYKIDDESVNVGNINKLMKFGTILNTKIDISIHFRSVGNAEDEITSSFKCLDVVIVKLGSGYKNDKLFINGETLVLEDEEMLLYEHSTKEVIEALKKGELTITDVEGINIREKEFNIQGPFLNMTEHRIEYLDSKYAEELHKILLQEE